MFTMKKAIPIFAVLVLAGVAVSNFSPVAAQSQSDRWLHVRVVETDEKGQPDETVKVNVPLALAEAILPAIKVKHLQGGKLRLSDLKIEQVDLRAILEAVKNTKDGEFVTIEKKRESVCVSKQGGYLLVKVNEGPEKQVDVKLPMAVVEAALSGAKDEVDLVAAIRALGAHGDHDLVNVKEKRQTVRVWVDSKNNGQ